MYCPKCGTDYNKTDEQCSRCGFALDGQKKRPKMVPVIAISAAVVAIGISSTLLLLSRAKDETEAGTPAMNPTAADAMSAERAPGANDNSMNDLQGVEVDSDDQLVAITLPPSLVTGDLGGTLTQEDMDDGIVEKTLREDGSLVMVYEKEAYGRYIGNLVAQTRSDLQDLREYYPFVRSVGYDEEFFRIDVYVDRSSFSIDHDSLVLYNAGVLGYKYQVFSGVPSSATSVAVIVVDADTQEPFHWEMFP